MVDEPGQESQVRRVETRNAGLGRGVQGQPHSEYSGVLEPNFPLKTGKASTIIIIIIIKVPVQTIFYCFQS
jgi:hypothetical protein